MSEPIYDRIGGGYEPAGREVTTLEPSGEMIAQRPSGKPELDLGLRLVVAELDQEPVSR